MQERISQLGFLDMLFLFPTAVLKASRRRSSLLEKDAFHGCCMYPISSLKPTGDKGDLEKTNISEKANRPKHPNSVYPSLAVKLGLGRSHGPQLSFNP